MSGHSKWSTIKHGKAVSDARRGKLFTRLTREIIAAVSQGGVDPEMNFRLRMAVQRAKDNNMPNDNVERAIKRASGDGDDAIRLTETMYEGYGPGGTAILLQVLTDNKNRTVSEVRSTFSKAGGNMSEAGSVAWQFQQRGVINVATGEDQADEITLAAIDAGAEDFESFDSVLSIYSAPESLETLRTTLTKYGAQLRSSELSMVATNTVSLDEKSAMSTLRLLDQLEELDDVQKVFSNADFPDEVLERYSGE
jgi:YebC/PmpR family DNA-binding regulatory protein